MQYHLECVKMPTQLNIIIYIKHWVSAITSAPIITLYYYIKTKGKIKPTISNVFLLQTCIQSCQVASHCLAKGFWFHIISPFVFILSPLLLFFIIKALNPYLDFDNKKIKAFNSAFDSIMACICSFCLLFLFGRIVATAYILVLLSYFASIVNKNFKSTEKYARNGFKAMSQTIIGGLWLTFIYAVFVDVLYCEEIKLGVGRLPYHSFGHIVIDQYLVYVFAEYLVSIHSTRYKQG
eukprot:144881_1